MPSAPPAGLRRALSAGYIPTYEALLRAACRDAERMLPTSTARGSTGISVMDARKATRLLRSLLLVAPGSKLLLLLGEGDPREAAALATTLCKAHLQHAELAAKAGSREGLQQAAGVVTGLARVMHRGLLREQFRPRVSRAELQEALGEQGGDRGGDDDSCGGGNSSGGGGGGSGARTRGGCGDGSSAPGGVDGDASDDGSDSFTAVAPSGAEMQHMLLASFMLPRLLPVMTRVGSLCFAAGLWGSEALHGLARTRGRLQKHAAIGAAFAATNEDCDEQRSWGQFQWNDLGADNVPVGTGAGVGLPEEEGEADGEAAGKEAPQRPGGSWQQEDGIQEGEMAPVG